MNNICKFYFQAILREQESGELTQAEVTVENQVSSFLRNVRQNLVRQKLVWQNFVRQKLVRQKLVWQKLNWQFYSVSSNVETTRVKNQVSFLRKVGCSTKLSSTEVS